MSNLYRILCFLSLMIAAVLAQNQVDSTSTCEPSSEWNEACNDCSCTSIESDLVKFKNIDDCKAYAELHGYDHISFRGRKCRLGYAEWCPPSIGMADKNGWDTHKLTIQDCPKHNYENQWSRYGDGRCETDVFPIADISLPSGFAFDGQFSPAGNMYYTQRVTLETCRELCLAEDWCAFFSWKQETMTSAETAWCYISADCHLVADENGYDNHSHLYVTYVKNAAEDFLYLKNKSCGDFRHVSESMSTKTDSPGKCMIYAYNECTNKEFFEWKKSNDACRCVEETDCDNAHSERIDVYRIKFTDNPVWSDMAGFDSVCSTSENSIEIRIDAQLYHELDGDYDANCETLCGSVGSVCLDGWDDVSNARCPVGDEITSFGCKKGHRQSFVCSCAVLPGAFALIDGAPNSNHSPAEIPNPDLSQKLGEVQCCHPDKGCTRRNPWNSGNENNCISGNNDNVQVSLYEAISMCDSLGDKWSLCTREETNSGLCQSKGCGHDSKLAWVREENQASRVVNYNDCISIESLTHGPNTPESRWNTECPDHHAVVSVETKVVETFMWTILRTQCCALVDKITTNGARIPEEGLLVGGGSFAVEDEWDVQCEPNAIMVGLFDNDDSGEFDDIDITKCRTLDSTFACGDKIDNSDCVVVDLLPNAISSCPIDYVLVGLYDDEYTRFNRVRKMKCCRVLECIPPTVSPTQKPSTSGPTEKPTTPPTSSIPSLSPSTEEPSLFPTTDEPTYFPTTEEPTVSPTKSPSTSGPSKSPTLDPTTDEPTYFPTTEKPTVSPTKSPSTSDPSKSPSSNPTTDEPTYFPTTDEPTVFPTKSPSTTRPSKSPSHSPTTDEPTYFPTKSPSTTHPSKSPSHNPTTDEPTYFPTTDEPTEQPTTSVPSKSPSSNPTTDEPTALPTAPPTYAPTICEPTCRSHSDQMVDLLGRILDFNRDLLNLARMKRLETLHSDLNEMISDLETLENQMNIVPDVVS